jgi:hypothetical protein
VTVTPLVPAVVPEWDPLPRPPRNTALWLALVSLLAAGAVGIWQGWSLARAPYTDRADACAALDLAPLASALGTVIAPATALELPGTAGPASETLRRCSFRADKPDGSPSVRGVVTLDWYPVAAVGAIYYELRRDQAARSIHEKAHLRDVPGLADAAFGYHDPNREPPSFQVGAVDANLLLEVGIAVSPGEPAWGSGDPGPAYAVLADTARASFARLR